MTAARIAKPTLLAIIALSYREGIGARRLARLIGYSAKHVRTMARDEGLPRLPRNTRRIEPSAELLDMIAAAVDQKVLAPTEHTR